MSAAALVAHEQALLALGRLMATTLPGDLDYARLGLLIADAVNGIPTVRAVWVRTEEAGRLRAVMEMAAHYVRTVDAMRHYADATPEYLGLRSALDALAAEPTEAAITHGRHCSCWPCRHEDWADPGLAPCGMHPKGCPTEAER